MDANEKNAFQERCRSMTTEDLLSATRIHRKDYQDEALYIMDSELASRNVPNERKNAIKGEIIKQEQMEVQRYQGIRGWLIVFILIVAGGSFIGLLYGLVELKEVPGFLGILLFISRVLIAIYGFDVMVLLLRKKPNAPAHAARWLIVNFFFSVIVAILVYVLYRNAAVLKVVWSSIGLALWLTYLQKSKRVAATYKYKKARYAHPDS